MTFNEKKYWENYYNDKSIVSSDNLQRNVGRTKNGQTISSELWEKTINDLIDVLRLKPTDDVLELCCGNGQVIGNLAPKSNKTVGVDYSKELLKQCVTNFPDIDEVINHDILSLTFPPETFNCIIIYFAIQHFNEEDTIKIIENAIEWLRPNGRIFLGDVPNEVKKWEYISEPEHKKDYIQRLLLQKPMIGTWYNPDFFNALAFYFNNIEVRILEQPDYQINSHYRFDVLIQT